MKSPGVCAGFGPHRGKVGALDNWTRGNVKLPFKPVKYLLCAALVLAAAGALRAQQPDSAAWVPFQVGEKLYFSVNWSVGNIGNAHMYVTAIDSFRGQPCYRIEAGASSNKTIDLFYPVRDYFLSLIDLRKLFSRKFVKRQKEGRTVNERQLIYDQERGIRFDLVKGDTVKIVPEAQDELSIFYYFRTLDLRVGEGYLLENFVDRAGNPLKVMVLRSEWVEVPAGRFFCFVVEPYIKQGGLFQHKGNLQIWITDDQNRIPVKVTSELDFGRIVVLLESFSLGGA
ncbi:MAG: hypothetical protein A2Z86_10815 [Candidatus Glassbacteria bacterium GWA2_58_10]|uniref:DUF3108 domain-containing protein n=1 Tax=Candidatus Glassbacteria bacterium GWA2_58_10 TaxID=1817865 RepID=A0A1F5YAD5_9BACT|nr:MAG: hypothetical protein A2Z86_10815 [Candidatus Glassbacteria bacterium GWA2_58_10]